MTVLDLRTLLNNEWSRLDRKAEAQKDSPRAVLELARVYRSLLVEERPAANQVFIEWAMSDNEKKRFDGLALIDEFSISSAIPALRKLAKTFKRATEPSAPYDLAKVNRILERLGGNASD